MYARMYGARLEREGKAYRLDNRSIHPSIGNSSIESTDSFTCHGCVSGRSGPFPLPRSYFSFLFPAARDFSNLRDAIPPSIRSRLVSPRWISSKANISSAPSFLLLRITCSSRVKGSYPVYDEGNGSCQTLRIQN